MVVKSCRKQLRFSIFYSIQAAPAVQRSGLLNSFGMTDEPSETGSFRGFFFLSSKSGNWITVLEAVCVSRAPPLQPGRGPFKCLNRSQEFLTNPATEEPSENVTVMYVYVPALTVLSGLTLEDDVISE